MPSNVPIMSAGLGDEMSSIPLGKIIGGPLMATVKAQGAADSTVRFCKKVAWTTTAMLPCGANFRPYQRLIYPYQRILDLMPKDSFQGPKSKHFA